jgi:hypothetical protein
VELSLFGANDVPRTLFLCHDKVVPDLFDGGAVSATVMDKFAYLDGHGRDKSQPPPSFLAKAWTVMSLVYPVASFLYWHYNEDKSPIIAAVIKELRDLHGTQLKPIGYNLSCPACR